LWWKAGPLHIIFSTWPEDLKKVLIFLSFACIMPTTLHKQFALACASANLHPANATFATELPPRLQEKV